MTKESKMVKPITRILTILLILYLFMSIALYFFQKKIIYHPTPKRSAAVGKPISWTVNNEQITGTVLNGNLPHAIIYFGGNAEQIEYTALEYKNFTNHTVYFINYRGYGGSTGTPSEKAIFDDVVKIYDIIKKQHRSISAIGRSLGSGVATYLASKRPIDRIILITPYDSIEHVAGEMYPYIFTSLLVTEKYKSYHYVKELNIPICIIYTETDGLISAERTENLIHHLAQKPTIHLINGVDHNSISTDSEYWAIQKSFLSNK